MPLHVGRGLQLTPALSTDATLRLEEQHVLPSGAVKLVYTFG
jgi:hypothetical protein